MADIFAPGLIATSIIVAIGYFFHITTFYFVLKWTPAIVADMGFPASSAAGVLVWANVGGACGGAVLGLLTLKFGVKGLTIGSMILSTVAVAVFGHSPADLATLSLLCAISGFFTNGAIVGMYAIFAHAFPTHVRAAGTGLRHRRGPRRVRAGTDHRGLPVQRGRQRSDRRDDPRARFAHRRDRGQLPEAQVRRYRRPTMRRKSRARRVVEPQARDRSLINRLLRGVRRRRGAWPRVPRAAF